MELSPLRFSAFLAFALALSPAALSNVVENIAVDGDFESAMGMSNTYTPYNSGISFDGVWTPNSDVTGGTYGAVGVDKSSGTVIDGATSVRLDIASIYQTLSTVPGQTYTISFSAYGPSFDPPLDVYFGASAPTMGTTPTYTANAPQNNFFDPPSPVGSYSFSATATGVSTVLTFDASGGAIELDDVKVIAQAAPEPAPLAALSLGIVGFVARRRRRTSR